MTSLGDPVFCIDCELAQRSAGANGSGAAEAAPKRLATKTDANGDPLCPACLDARLTRRRAEFELHQGVDSGHAVQPASDSAPPTTGSGTRFWSSARMTRTSPSATRKVRASTHWSRSERLATSTSDRNQEHRFLEIAVEIGFVRAQELLWELKLLAVPGRTF